MYQTLQTIRDLIRYATSNFIKHQLYFGHGSDNAYDEAVYLVLHTLHLPVDMLEPFLDARVLEQERQACLELIHTRIRTRQPLAHLIGETYLQGERFLCNPNVIVPRSPIAELLSEQLTPWIDDPEMPMNILDMCTGSACLAILASKAFPHAQVDAVDISDDAIDLAERNIKLHNAKQVKLIQSDVFESLPAENQYHLIICNPPYVNSQSMNNLPEEYRHEPSLALDGGEDGMDFIRAFLAVAHNYLQDDGFIVLEVGNEADFFEAAFPNLAFTYLPTQQNDRAVLLIEAQAL